MATAPARRQIGLPAATALVMANMLGTGIFTTTGFLLADVPSRGFVLLAWLVGGAIALLGAVCYGALARRLPESGGEYFFLSRTIHPAAGYVSGWMSFLVGFSAPIAAAGIALGEYAAPWFPASVPPRWIGTGVLVGVAGVHLLRTRTAARTQTAVVVFKLLLLAAFLAVAVPRLGDAGPGPAGTVSAGSFGASLIWISFAYSGWNAAVYVGGEVERPERNLPRAMIFGTLAIGALYLALNAVFVFGAPVEQIAGQLQVARIVAVHLAGPAFGELVTVLIVVALLTSISAMVMAGPRVYAKMAEDGYLPRWVAADRPPARNAVLLQLGVALLMVWVPSFPDLAKYIGFTLGIGAALTVVGLMRLKLRSTEPLPVPGWPWVPALFLIAVAATTLAAIVREPRASLFGMLTVAAGLVAWKALHGRR